MKPDSTELTREGFVPWIGRLVRANRRRIGWSQQELARRAMTSQSTVARLEADAHEYVDLCVVERVLDSMGATVSMSVDLRHLGDRDRQRDGIHALVNGFSARRHEASKWITASEVPVGLARPRGWIDLLGFRTADRALLIQETKGDLPDFGGLQRSVAFYAREAMGVARELGWDPVKQAVLVVGLDSRTFADRMHDNRDLVARAFPGDLPTMIRWLEDPAAPPPTSWTFAMTDPHSRRTPWLLPPILGSVRRRPAYDSYADAAHQLLRS